MAGYDICISLSESELNAGAAAVYRKLYGAGKVFRGKGQVTQKGVKFDVGYDVTKAPVFDLSPPSREALIATITGGARGLSKFAEDQRAALAAFAADQEVTFSLNFPDIAFQFSSPGVDPVKLVTPLTVFCAISNEGGTTRFQIVKATAPKQPTVGAQFIVSNFIIPTIESDAGKLFSGLRIPPLSIPGVELTAPVLLVARKRVFAAALIAGTGTPSLPPDGAPGPDAAFYTLLNRAAMQAAAGNAIGKSGRMSKHGKKGSKAFNAHYRFDYRLENPHVSLDGAELDIAFDLSGAVSAGVTVFFVPITLGYAAKAEPKPAARCAIEPTAKSLDIVEKSLKAFTLLVVPTGSIPGKVLGWMTEFIVQGIVAALTPLVTAFLKNIRFTSLDVPSFSETVDGQTITMSPTGLSVKSVASMIALTGSLKFT